MTDETMRAEFERWAKSPPYERITLRYPHDEQRFAWPGQYRDVQVQFAWEAWRIALTAERTRCAAIARAAGREDIAAEIEKCS